MKRFLVYFAALAVISVLFTGCGGADNVSDNTDGMIESSSQATESSARVTVPTESMNADPQGSSESGMNGGIGSDTGTDGSGTDSTEASTEGAPSARGRGSRRF